MKILALDLGDKWVGTAISDPLGITCKPYQTVDLAQLAPFLAQVLGKEQVTTVVIGYPKTMSGGQSEQTLKIVKIKKELERQFPSIDGSSITWILWDERLSSKRANTLQNSKNDPEAKKKSHSLAAAFILQSYLDYLASQEK